jgi:dTDP-glucose 4,6-dehydratase/UDP-glucose 4-epimerase
VPSRVLVTGGFGFLGSHLVRGLLRRGCEVVVLDNAFRGSKNKLSATEHAAIREFEGDIRDSTIVRQAMQGVDCVCHLAFINGTRYFYEMPDQVLEVGIKGVLNTLEAAIACNVPDYIFASSSEVYQSASVIPTPEDVPASIPDVLNPRYSYGGAKLLGELMAFNYGRKHFARTVVFRPHNVYGADMGYEHVIPEFAVRMQHHWAEGKRAFGFPIQGDGLDTRAFVYIDDFTDGLLRVVFDGQDQNVYHIGNDEEVTVADLAHRIAGIMGCEITLEPSERPRGATSRRCPDIRKLRTLGYRPQIPLSEGLRRTVAWYREHPTRS